MKCTCNFDRLKRYFSSTDMPKHYIQAITLTFEKAPFDIHSVLSSAVFMKLTFSWSNHIQLSDQIVLRQYNCISQELNIFLHTDPACFSWAVISMFIMVLI